MAEFDLSRACRHHCAVPKSSVPDLFEGELIKEKKLRETNYDIARNEAILYRDRSTRLSLVENDLVFEIALNKISRSVCE